MVFSHGLRACAEPTTRSAKLRRAFTFSLLLVVCMGVLFALLLSATVYTYHRLTAETLIAELRFEATGERQYLAHLRTGDRCGERVLPLFGDQWRVDAEFVKWKYWATLLGLDSQYRLDRLEGRYRSTAEQNTGARLAHELGNDTVLDVVGVAAALGSWNFLLDATYGSSTYQDIDVDNTYYVYRTATGIITRSELRAPEIQGGGLAIEITTACGAEAPLWERMATWTDARVQGVLAMLR
jgi:hypothetical protein